MKQTAQVLAVGSSLSKVHTGHERTKDVMGEGSENANARHLDAAAAQDSAQAYSASLRAPPGDRDFRPSAFISVSQYVSLTSLMSK